MKRYTTKDGAVYEVQEDRVRVTKKSRPDEKFRALNTWYRTVGTYHVEGRLIFLWADGSETSSAPVQSVEKCGDEADVIDVDAYAPDEFDDEDVLS